MNKLPETRRENRSRSLFDLMAAFDDIFNRSYSSLPALGDWPAQPLSRMLTDVQEDDKAYVLSVDMPGVSKDDIQIQMDNNVLTISAEKQSEKNAKDATEEYSRQYRKYQQSFTLPSSVSVDQIEASYENGVLELFIPKSPEAQPKKIEVRAGQGGFINRLLGKGSQSQQAQGKTEQTSMKH